MRPWAALFPALAAFAVPVLASASPVEAPNKAWLEDRYSQTIFFAVLEGLYRDGISNEVVDLVLAPDPVAGGRDHFVSACPLCSPALEAFRLYRERPMFEGLKSPMDTFRAAPSDGLAAKLRSPVKQERLDAVQGLIEAWVAQRLTLMRLSEAEQQDWADNLQVRRKEGMARLGEREDWKNCAICDGSVNGCKRIRRPTPP